MKEKLRVKCTEVKKHQGISTQKPELIPLYWYYTNRELYFRVGNEWSEQSQVPSEAVTQDQNLGKNGKVKLKTPQDKRKTK